jgi:hypothetical protein
VEEEAGMSASTPDVNGELQELVRQAQSGDESVLPALRRFLDGRPDVWRQVGDLRAHAEEALLGLAAGPSLLAREAIRRKAAELRAELAGPSPTAVEGLLAERAALCWLQLHLADLAWAAQGEPGAPPAARRELQQRLDSSQRRYLAALRQLDQARKRLGRPQTPPPASGLRVVG